MNFNLSTFKLFHNIMGVFFLENAFEDDPDEEVYIDTFIQIKNWNQKIRVYGFEKCENTNDNFNK